MKKATIQFENGEQIKIDLFEEMLQERLKTSSA